MVALDQTFLLLGWKSVLLGVLATFLVAQLPRCVRYLLKQVSFIRATRDYPTVEWYGARNLWKFGSIIKEVLGPFGSHPFLSATHPETAKCILAKPDAKLNTVWGYFKPWLGEGLLTSHGKKWLRSRRLLTPAFHFGVLRSYVPIFQMATNEVLEKWEHECRSNDCVEVFQGICEMALNSLIRCALGDFKISEKESLEFGTAMSTCFTEYRKRRRTMSAYFVYDWLYALSTSGRRFKNAVKIMRKLAARWLQRKREERMITGSDVTQGFIDIVINAQDVDGSGLDDAEIIDQIQTFMFAGQDTIRSALAPLFRNMALHEDFQQKCREEIEEVLEGRENVTLDDLNKMKFLTMCIKESLRHDPPVHGFSRTATQDIHLTDGRLIPKGMDTGVSIINVHYNPDVWTNPEIYDPMRFSSDHLERRHSHAFIAFSAGPRNCIGQQFAMTKMKVIMALTLRKFVIALDNNRIWDSEDTLLMKPREDIWFKLKPLSDDSNIMD